MQGLFWGNMRRSEKWVLGVMLAAEWAASEGVVWPGWISWGGVWRGGNPEPHCWAGGYISTPDGAVRMERLELVPGLCGSFF